MSRDAGRALEPEGIAEVTPRNRLALRLCPACAGGIRRLGVADDALVGLADDRIEDIDRHMYSESSHRLL